MTQVKAEITIHAPIAKVWKAVTHHEGMIAWPKVNTVKILKKGSNHSDGLGCIREVTSDRMYVKEEITKFDIHRQMNFQVLATNLPIIHHGGQIIFTDNENGSTSVIWKSKIEITSKNLIKRLISPWVIKQQGEKGLMNSLRWIKQDLENDTSQVL